MRIFIGYRFVVWLLVSLFASPVKLHLRPSNPQLTPPTLQIQYYYSLNAACQVETQQIQIWNLWFLTRLCIEHVIFWTQCEQTNNYYLGCTSKKFELKVRSQNSQVINVNDYFCLLIGCIFNIKWVIFQLYLYRVFTNNKIACMLQAI